MKKILLVAPLSEKYSGVYNYGAPAIGVHRMASFLRSNGIDVTVYDCNIHGSIEPYLHTKYDIIGISILNNTLALSLELFIRLSKDFPDTLLVAGGAEAILNYQEIFDNTKVNIVVLGEGELPMLDICNDKPLDKIPGLILRKQGLEITDNMLWDFYKDMDFIKMGWREYWAINRKENDPYSKNNVVRLVTSTHCNRGCSFCSLTRLHEFSCGRKVKPAFLNSTQIRVLIDRILEQLPETTHIYFVEDSILPTVSRIDDFCEALRPYKDRLKYFVQTETDKVSEDIIRKLSEVNVIQITFGVENCSPRIRKFMGKPQNEQKIEDIIKWCNKYGIRCYYLIIIFSPESNLDDLRINFETMRRWETEGKVAISIEPFMMPYKGAGIYYSDYEFGYNITKLSNGKVLKHPYVIYPGDPAVRKLMTKFRERMPTYLDEYNRKQGHTHRSKDLTGPVYIQLLGDLLNEKEQEV